MAEDEEEIEVVDISMSEAEIDEVIAHLLELKEHKSDVQFPIAADMDLHVRYDTEVSASTDTSDDGDDNDDDDDEDEGEEEV